MFWERFSTICFLRGEKPNSVANAIGISSATITKWKNGAIPNSDFVTKIAEYFNIPTDFLLGNGIFKYWDDLLHRKSEIIEAISVATSKLSKDMLNDLDDMAFAKLVFAFNVSVQEHGDGFGITLTDPFPTYPPLNLHNKQKKADGDNEWLSLIHRLPEKKRDEFKERIKGYLECYEEPVAADEALKKTGTENMGK